MSTRPCKGCNISGTIEAQGSHCRSVTQSEGLRGLGAVAQRDRQWADLIAEIDRDLLG